MNAYNNSSSLRCPWNNNNAYVLESCEFAKKYIKNMLHSWLLYFYYTNSVPCCNTARHVVVSHFLHFLPSKMNMWKGRRRGEWNINRQTGKARKEYYSHCARLKACNMNTIMLVLWRRVSSALTLVSSSVLSSLHFCFRAWRLLEHWILSFMCININQKVSKGVWVESGL